MSVHPIGDGAAWVEDVDVDQPHGLDFRYENHIAKAVRLRMEKGHKAFVDDTGGGEHLAGGAGILGIEITNDAGDPTLAIASDGTYKGRGLIWMVEDDTSYSVLWCSTAESESTLATDWTILAMHPDKQWKGGDVTWQGNHQFDSSVQFYDPVDFTGPLSIDGTVDFSGSVVDFHETVRFSDGTSIIVIADDTLVIDNTTASKGVRADCTFTFTKAVDFTGSSIIMNGNMNVTGAGAGAGVLGNLRITSDGEFDLSGSAMIIDTTSSMSICGDVSASGGGHWSIFNAETSLDGDGAVLGDDVTYQVTTDGILTVNVFDLNSAPVILYVDDTAGLTATSRKAGFQAGQNGFEAGLSYPIHKGQFWCITTSVAITGGGGVVRWHPIGDGSCDKAI